MANVQELPLHPSEIRNGIETLDSDIFILGGVATGKTELTNALAHELPYIPLDVGKLFRHVAVTLLNDTEKNTISPDFDLIRSDNAEEIDRIRKIIHRKTKLLEQSLRGLEFSKNSEGQFELSTPGIYTTEIDSLVPILAKMPSMRKLVWDWIRNLSKSKYCRVILTGHNLREIDTTRFKVINLTVTDEVAGERLLQRSDNYADTETAISSVRRRNESDGLLATKQFIDGVHGIISVNTVGMTVENVTKSVLEILDKSQRQEKAIRNAYESRAIERHSFAWLQNPIMEILKANFREVLKSPEFSGVDHFDLLLQCLLHAPAFSLEELSMDKQNENIIRQMSGNASQIELLSNEIVREKFVPIAKQQHARLLEITKSAKPEPEVPCLREYRLSMKGGKEYSQGDICRHLAIEAPEIRQKFIFKPCSKELSSRIAYEKHYLHIGRTDELISFWVFLEGHDYPIAWVSYSPHDRSYKKELLQHIGIESHNTLEMTRAWNHPNAPKNTMSALFSYAHTELRSIWEDHKKAGKTDKSLAAITTAINPNLWFKGSAFFGSNFEVFALRPATLTYRQEPDGMPEYATRRELPSDAWNRVVLWNAKIEQLHLNEMIMCYDSEKLKKISEGKIYQMDKSIYNSL